jgi:hypothetical protein
MEWSETTTPSQASRHRLKLSQVGNFWVSRTTVLDDGAVSMDVQAFDFRFAAGLELG